MFEYRCPYDTKAVCDMRFPCYRCQWFKPKRVTPIKKDKNNGCPVCGRTDVTCRGKVLNHYFNNDSLLQVCKGSGLSSARKGKT
jgi:hypothetical protein